MRPYDQQPKQNTDQPTGNLGMESEIHNLIFRQDGLLVDLFADMDWPTWARFCVKNPQFKIMDNHMQKHILILNPNSKLDASLIERYHRVKRVHITMKIPHLNAINTFTINTYRAFTSIQELQIYQVTAPINFITSTQIRALTVFSPVIEYNEEDLVENILEISRNISFLQYSGGSFSTASITYSQLNPIQTLFFYNVIIYNKMHFIWFLSNSPNLKHLALMGWKYNDSQLCFFAKPNTNRGQIKSLHLRLISGLGNSYRRIEECTRLEHLILYYDDYRTMEYFYSLIPKIPNIEEIELHAFLHPNSLEATNDQSIFNSYIDAFMAMGIEITRFIHPTQN